MISPARVLARSTVLAGLLGSCLLPTAALAGGPPNIPLAECHDLSIAFSHLTPTSYTVTVSALVTTSGIFSLGTVGGSTGHSYFGSSSTPTFPPPGHLETNTTNAQGGAPDTTVTWTATCEGGVRATATATVRTPSAPRPTAPPTIQVRGTTTLLSNHPGKITNPLRATGHDSLGRSLAAGCAPALLPPATFVGRTVVTCTTAKDAAGLRASATRVVTLRGPGFELDTVRRSLPAGAALGHLDHARGLLHSPSAAVYDLGLALDSLQQSGVPAARQNSVLHALEQVSRALGMRIPALHLVRPGDTLWGVVRDRLTFGLSRTPAPRAIALGVPKVLAANPGLTDALRPGAVLRLPI